jgi:hypothetical protein
MRLDPWRETGLAAGGPHGRDTRQVRWGNGGQFGGKCGPPTGASSANADTQSSANKSKRHKRSDYALVGEAALLGPVHARRRESDVPRRDHRRAGRLLMSRYAST